MIFLLISYHDINCDILPAATNISYAVDNDTRLVNLGVIGLFSNYKLRTSSVKHLEGITQTHIVPSMYKLITSATDTDDLSIDFDRDPGRKQRELTNNKTQKGKFGLRIMLKFAFGFSQCQKRNVWTRSQINNNRKY